MNVELDRTTAVFQRVARRLQIAAADRRPLTARDRSRVAEVLAQQWERQHGSRDAVLGKGHRSASGQVKSQTRTPSQSKSHDSTSKSQSHSHGHGH